MREALVDDKDLTLLMVANHSEVAISDVRIDPETAARLIELRLVQLDVGTGLLSITEAGTAKLGRWTESNDVPRP